MLTITSSTLEKLYNGELYPYNAIVPNSPECKKDWSRIEELTSILASN